MNDITQEYLLLFRAISDATETLERVQRQLMTAQQLGEYLYLGKEIDTPAFESDLHA